jgi:hypothetical protein
LRRPPACAADAEPAWLGLETAPQRANSTSSL